MNKTGVIITLIGIGLFFISIFASEGYDQGRSIMGNMYAMEVVIYSGRLEWDEPKDELSKALEKLRRSSSPRIVGAISIPLSFLLSLSTIITLVGIGKVILGKKQK